MTQARWQFRPSWWAVLGTVAGCALTLSLGVWQLQRGLAKQALQTRYDSAAAQPALQLNADTPAPRGDVQRAQAVGHYWAERQLLLDNQTHQRQPGYDVWTPLRLHNGGVLIVNRGWIAARGARGEVPPLPVPEGEIRVSGLWRALPQPGLRVAADDCAPPAQFPATVNYPTAQDLACALGLHVADGVLLLDADAPGGYVREWQQVSEFPPERHFGYAAQWFAFALTLLALFIKLNLTKLNLQRPHD